MNSTCARILRVLDADYDSWPVELVMKSDSRKLRNVMSGKQGSPFLSANSGQRSVITNENGPIAEDKREFIRQVFALLESHRRANEFDELAIFAEKDALGALQEMMPPMLREKVVWAVRKDLLHLSAKDLPKAILDELNNGRHVI